MTMEVRHRKNKSVGEQRQPPDSFEGETLQSNDGPMPQEGTDESESPQSSASPGTNEKEPEEDPRISLWGFLTGEIKRGYAFENEEEKFRQRREQVYTFIRIPKEMEKFMFYGLLQLTDAFLYVFTFLPIRMFLALLEMRPVSALGASPTPRSSQRKLFPGLTNTSFRKSTRRLGPAHICDLLKGILMILCGVCLNYVDTSRMYHVIRGQAVIKLYIFFNMLDVGDRLLASFGQDILDALFWTATEQRGRKREHIGTVPHFVLAIVYIFLHAILMLFQATTLNVAFNSHNKALLTIMMSNNFVELKGSVFKKFEKNNLFQMSCSDVRERFHLCILLVIVVTRNMTEFNWNWDHLWVILPDAVMVLLAEFLVDWVKHAFITKFNDISDEVYTEYRASLAYDLAASRQMRYAIADDSDVLSRRMGFCPMPLAILLFRIFCQSVTVTDYFGFFLLILTYLCLLTTKIIISIILLAFAHSFILNDKIKTARSQVRDEKSLWDPRPKITRRRSLHEISSTRKQRRDGAKTNRNGEGASSSSPNKEDVTAEDELAFFQLHRSPSDPSGLQIQTPPQPHSGSGDFLNSGPSISFTDVGAAPRPSHNLESTSSLPLLTTPPEPPPSVLGATPRISFSEHKLTSPSSNHEDFSSMDSPPSFSAAHESSLESALDVKTDAPKKAPPLSQVDRFTMCSNRIV